MRARFYQTVALFRLQRSRDMGFYQSDPIDGALTTKGDALKGLPPPGPSHGGTRKAGLFYHLCRIFYFI